MSAVVTFDLHDATWQAYDTAHKILGEYGFSRTVPATNGPPVHLPDTTVVAEHYESATAIRAVILDRFVNAGLN